MTYHESAKKRLTRLQDELHQALCSGDDTEDIMIAIEVAREDVYAEQAIEALRVRDNSEKKL